MNWTDETSLLAAPPTAARFLGPAEVIEVSGRSVVVAMDLCEAEATNAAAGYRPTVGDTALVLGDGASGYYILGVLQSSVAPGGFTAATDPVTGCTRVEVADGDLELVAPAGKVRLVSRDGIELVSGGAIDLRSTTSVRFSVFDRLGRVLSKLGITGRRTTIQNEQLEFSAADAQIDCGRGRLRSDDWRAECHRAELKSARVTIATETIVTTAKNAYSKVAELWQLTAGRSRSVVDRTAHTKAKRIYSKATDDVKIKAEKIHLG